MLVRRRDRSLASSQCARSPDSSQSIPHATLGDQGAAAAGTSCQPSLDVGGVHHEAPGHHSSVHVTGGEQGLDALLGDAELLGCLP